MTEERIIHSILIGVALVLGVTGCPPEPPIDDDAGVGGSAPTGGMTSSGGVTSSGGAATGGESGSAGSAGAGGEGGACTVPAQSVSPFATTLRFTNPGPEPRWLVSGFTLSCDIKFTLTSCMDGYQTPVLIAGYDPCIAVCPACLGYVCAPCEMLTVLVAPGSYYDLAWNGYDPVRETSASDAGASCECVRWREAPAGLYRVSVPVWTSEPQSTLDVYDYWNYPAYTVTQDFTLDHAGGIVEVRL